MEIQGITQSTDVFFKKAHEQKESILKYAKSNTNMPIDALTTQSIKNRLITKVNKEDIKTYLESPQKYEKELRNLSDYLCKTSPQFSALVEYIPNMAYIVPFVKQKLSKYSKGKNKERDFIKMCDFVEKYDIKSTSMKIIQEVFKHGVFYGLEIEGKYKVYTKMLQPDYCKIIAEGEAGYQIAFDFTFFNNNEYLLDNGYPPEFRTLYNTYKAGTKTLEGLKLGAQWQPIDPSMTFVVKLDTGHLDYSIPPFINVFEALYDLEDYQSLNKAKVTAENYTLIALKIPSFDDKTGAQDNFIISDDMLDAVTSRLDASLPEYMGYFTTPTEVDTIKASSPNDGKIDQVANATKSFWNSVGFAEALFGVGNSNTGTLEYSVKVDQQKLFPIYRQIENHYDFKLRDNFKNNFKFKLLDVTWFNLEDFISYIIQQAQFSVPVAQILPLLLGFEVDDIHDLALMQEEIFDLYNTWKPLQSSYAPINTDNASEQESGSESEQNNSNNKSSNKSKKKTTTATGGTGSTNGGGRPTKKNKDLTISGENAKNNK